MSNDTAGSCYPLQEVLRTAFPDLKFTTMQVMNMQDDLARRFGQVIERRQADSSPTPAPAPMTAANPGNQSLGPSRYIEVDREKYDALTARVAELERELAAARKVEDGEIADVAAWLRHEAAQMSRDAGIIARFDKAVDLLTRLYAELKEAKADTYRLAKELASRNDTIDRLNVQCNARAQAAEAKLETARRDALEEAAARCDAIAQKVFEIRMLSEDMRGFDIQPAGCAAAIRALQTKDTTP